VPDVVTPGWFDFRPIVGPHAVAGRERQVLSGCLDLRRTLRFEMAGYLVTNLAGDPGYRAASNGAGFGLALRDSVVRPTSAFALRHRQPGSADTFGSTVVTEDDVRPVFTYARLRVHRSAAAPL
jgi:hypothetical protein